MVVTYEVVSSEGTGTFWDFPAAMREVIAVEKDGSPVTLYRTISESEDAFYSGEGDWRVIYATGGVR